MAGNSAKSERLFSKIREGLPLSTKEEIELVIRLSLPAIFAQISFVAMQYIDAAMVGHLGEVPAAAVALVMASTWLMWALIGSATAPFSVQVAHKIGAKDYDGARNILRQGLLTGLLISTFIGLVCAVISPDLPRWLGGSPNLYPDASAYYLVFALGMPIFQLNFISSSMLRSIGNVQLPSLINIGMCFLDVIFNFLLIFPTNTYTVLGHTFTFWGADLGVTGAALGTLLAEAVSVVIMMYFVLVKNDKIALAGHPGSFKLTKAVMRRSLNIGLPMAGERCSMTFAQIVTTMIVAPLGNAALAAHSFAITAESLCYMPGYGVADAASTVVGQSYGAGRRDLARKLAWINVGLAMAIMSVMGVVMYIFAPVMIGVMTPIDRIVQLGSDCLRIQAFAEPFFAAAIVCYSVFVSLGRTLVSSCINFGCMWGIRLPAAYFLSLSFGLIGVWIAMAAELTLRGTIFLFRLKGTNFAKPKEL